MADSEDVPQQARVVKINGRTGARGNVTQVIAELLHSQRPVTRNIKGPVRVGDILCLCESEREARRLR